MKPISMIMAALMTALTSGCMGGHRTAAVLDVHKSTHATVDFVVRSFIPYETFGFEPKGDQMEPYRNPIYETHVQISITNRSAVPIQYPDPAWVPKQEAQPYLVLPPHGTTNLYSGPFGKFRIVMGQTNGVKAKASLNLKFANEVTSQKDFILFAAWTDGP